MNAEKTRDKGDEENSSDFGFAPMGQQMSEMMKEYCAGRGGFPDCLTGMEGMLEAMKKKHCCKPNKDAAEPERKKK